MKTSKYDHIPAQVAFWVMMVAMIFIHCSCSTMRYNIAQRHLDKIGLEICDTITIHDTTVITESRIDTVLRINEITHDTVIIREGQSEVRYFYNTHDSTIFIEGKCHDTIIVKDRSAQVRTVSTYRGFNDSLYLKIILSLVVGIFLRGIVKDSQGIIKQYRDRKSTRLNSSHSQQSRMPSSA